MGRDEVVWDGRLPGIFEGYDCQRVYQLGDGSTWRQECRTREFCWRDRPTARLTFSRWQNTYYLDVEGTSAVVIVRRWNSLQWLGCEAY